MIIGIGNDILEMQRIKKACQKPAFWNKIYTQKEIDFLQKNIKKAAGNFCVKEAVVKVLGTGFGTISPQEIEVFRNESGQPYVVLIGKAKERAEKMQLNRLCVTISDTKEYVSAVAIGERMD